MIASIPGPRRALIAQANASEAQRLARILHGEGFDVLLANNGRMALEMAQREKPRVIVSDLTMPEMNGDELCAHIKSHRELAEVPVILALPLDVPADVVRGLQSPADHFVLKPYDGAQVARRIHCVMAEKAAQSQQEQRRALDPTASSGRHAALPAGSRTLRVLLVDDDPALLESLRNSLQDEGHKVTTTSGGQAGIDAFRDAQRAGKVFDIVITDLGMPYVDGREVIASVRDMSPGTPIILLTGRGQQVLDEQLAPQVDRLLGKPPRVRELRAALTELTARRATDRLG